MLWKHTNTPPTKSTPPIPNVPQHVKNDDLPPGIFINAASHPHHPPSTLPPGTMFVGCAASLVIGSRTVGCILPIIRPTTSRSPGPSPSSSSPHPQPPSHPPHTVLPFPQTIMFVGCAMLLAIGSRIASTFEPRSPSILPSTPPVTLPARHTPVRHHHTGTQCIRHLLLHSPPHPLHHTFASYVIYRVIGSSNACQFCSPPLSQTALRIRAHVVVVCFNLLILMYCDPRLWSHSS